MIPFGYVMTRCSECALPCPHCGPIEYRTDTPMPKRGATRHEWEWWDASASHLRNANTEIRRLEKQNRWLRVCIGVLIFAVLVGLWRSGY